MTETHAPRARTARDVARKGPNAVLHEDVPACWLPYLEDGNPEGLDDNDPWSAAACDTWAEQRTAEGYIYSGPAPYAGAPEWGDFSGVHGDLARVCLVNQDVLDSDADAVLFSIGGTDELPSEYLLRRDVDGVVRLPANFEPRIADPDEPADDPRHAETAPVRPFRNAEDGRHAPERINPDEATDVDEAWTTPACDLALLHLAVDGWRIECELPGCERDGWYAGRYGRTSLWLMTRATSPAETAPAREHERPHAYTLYGTTLRTKTARDGRIEAGARAARTFEETIDDAVRRLPGATRPEDVDIRAWTADFSDASLGFGGPAGQTTTTALVVAVTDHRHVEVYVAGRHAYTACTEADETALGRMFHCSLPGRTEARRTLTPALRCACKPARRI